MGISKYGGFNSPQLAALGLNLPFIETPWLAAEKFIEYSKKKSKILPLEEFLGFRPESQELRIRKIL
jgi:hypothetical protein